MNKQPAETRRTRTLAQAGIFTALILLFTYTLKVPSPGLGYVHVGDGFILTTPLLLSTPLAAVVSAIGSTLSDLLGGYFIFVPGTFLIKGVEAALASFLYRGLTRTTAADPKRAFPRFLLAAVVASMWMVLGYFLYEWAFMGLGVAIAAIVSNLGQALMSVILAALLYYPACRLAQQRAAVL